MTEQQIRHLFTFWQQRLGLAEWRIRIDFEAIDPDTYTMQIHRSEQYQRATVKVQPWVLTNSPPKDWQAGIGSISDLDIEESIVHELLHAAIGPLWIWRKMLRPECHTDAIDTAERAYDHLEEGLVDKLAVALVKAWPKSLTG